MISAPPDPLGQRKSRSAPVPMEVQSAYAELLSSFVNALWSLVHPYEMNIEPEAVEMLLDFQDKIEPRLGKDGDLRPLGGFAGKIVGSAARFAALHHLGWYGLQGLELPITVGSVAPGIKLARYAIEHYRYVMAATGFVTEIAIADRIVQWCHRGQRSEFSRRDGPERPPHLARGRDGGAATTTGGQRLREVGRSPACRAHRTQAIRHVPRKPSRVAARFCQFCRASSVRRWCLASTCSVEFVVLSQHR